jgi:Fungal specific transcription factor domain
MVWGLTGLALRIAQCMGLHRDGTHSKGLTPFEIEMRRRLWHQICLIDVRAAETLGFAPSSIETDTRVPLNIDDSDISPESDKFPEARTGMTEMSLAIMRIKFGIVYRRLISTRQVLTLAERVKMVEDYERAVHREFLESREQTEFLRNIADTAIKSLMWLGIYREERALSKADKDHLFINAIQVVELTHELHKDSGCKRWSWLFTSLVSL